MATAWHEILGGYGPNEDVNGLDVLVRKYQGDATLWPAFKLQLALRSSDATYPALYLTSISPEHQPAGLMTATVTYKGLLAGGDGTSKYAQIDHTKPIKSTSVDSYRVMTFWPYAAQAIRRASTGTISFSYHCPTVTFRYVRSVWQSSPNYGQIAATLLTNQDLTPFDFRWSQNSAAWTYPIGTYRAIELEDLASVADRVLKPQGAVTYEVAYGSYTNFFGHGLGICCQLGDFNQKQVGVWYECEETWGIGVLDPNQNGFFQNQIGFV